MKTFIRKRKWLGFWWGSICSKHEKYNPSCNLCQKGHWVVAPEILWHIRRIFTGELSVCRNKEWTWGAQHVYYDGDHYVLHCGPFSIGSTY